MRIAGRKVSAAALAVMIFGLISVVGVFWTVVEFRPQNEFIYHLSSGDPISLNAENFNGNIRDNLYGIVSGKIDRDRSFVAGRRSKRFALIRFKDSPQSFAMLLTEGPLFDRLVEKYEQNVEGPDRWDQRLSFFIDANDMLLTSKHRIDGRVLSTASVSVLYKYKLRLFLESPEWVMDASAVPSIDGLANEHIGLPAMFLAFAILFGTPTIYVLLSGYSIQLERLEISQPIESSVDIQVNHDVVIKRINNFLNGSDKERVLDEFGTSIGARFSLFLTLIAWGLRFCLQLSGRETVLHIYGPQSDSLLSTIWEKANFVKICDSSLRERSLLIPTFLMEI